MHDDPQIRQRICDVGQRMYDKGFVAANDGNISYRFGRGRYLCTPADISKGFMKPGDLVVVDDRGNQLSGERRRPTEILLHLAVYRQLPQINAVAHCHAPYATAFAASGVSIPMAILPEMDVLLGPVPTVAYDDPGSESLAVAIVEHLQRGTNTILLANHGPIGFDRDLDQAFYHIEKLDMYCQILLLIRQIGSVQMIPEDKLRGLLALKQRLGLDDPRLRGDEPVYPRAADSAYLRHFLDLGTLRTGASPDSESEAKT
jgi:L-fuculose-phosphate aldolase